MRLPRRRPGGILAGTLLLLATACAPAATIPTAPAPAAPGPAANGATTDVPAASVWQEATRPGVEQQALVEAARREGQLTFVWGASTMGGPDGLRRLADGFNKRYGLQLDVQFTPGPSMPEMAQRIAQEYQAGRPASSDLVPGYAVHMAVAVAANALEPVDWLSWAENVRRAEQIVAGGTAVTFETSTPGITYNTARVRADEVPTSLQDLLNPRYKGRIASTPFAANFDYLATDDLWGESRTMEYLTKLADQAAGLMRCTEHERLVTGEFDLLALDCSQNNALALQAKGAPIGFTLAADAPLLLPLYVGVPRNARHPNAAKLWVDYLVSREAQDVLYDENSSDSHLVAGSKSAERVEALQRAGVRFSVADVDFVQRQDEAEFNRRRARAQEILQKR
jgi:ABC-type Fe3+ transport system substrate-binding protein